MKIGYFADGPWGHLAFEKIIADKSLEIVFLTVRYDKQDPVLIEMAKQYDIPVIIYKNVNTPEAQAEYERFGADLFVSMSFNQIFKSEFINLPPLKTINCHAGKLPFYRGRNILNWVLINDEPEFGITVHYVDEGIDTGDIILQKTYPITDEDSYATLLERAYIGCADILYEAIKMLQAGNVKPVSQKTIDPVGLYCGMRQVGDEVLDWNQSSREVFNFVRAICSPGPQARTFLNGEEMRINKVREIKGAHSYKNIQGQVLGKTNTGLLIKTKDIMVEIVEYDFDGRIRVGDRLTSTR